MQNKIRIYNKDSLPELTELKANKLGRPWHKVPQIFNERFDLIDAHISIYFLKKFRVNISLNKMHFEMDSFQKYSQIMSTRLGNIAFQIERPLLLNILHDYYGLAKESMEPAEIISAPVTKTEERLKNKLGLELAEFILNDTLFSEPLDIKNDYNALIGHWSYRITFALEGYQDGNFSLLLDGHHIDALLAALCSSQDTLARKPENFTTRQLETMVSTLPLQLTGHLASVAMTVAQLSELKTGDVLPISLPDCFPLHVGSQPLFNAVVSEDRGRLFFSEFTDRINDQHD